jgi:DNA-binding NtrC family response regulator
MSTILVVEDEVVVSLFLTTILREQGFGVAAATCAAEAVQMLASPPQDFGGAIIDIGLPDSPGDALVDRIHASRPELPILVATGFSELEMAQRFRNERGIHVIGKPFDENALLCALEVFGRERPPLS